MPISHVEAFRAVMVSGSTTAAARILNTSQPNASRSIAQLEKSMGLRRSTMDRLGYCRLSIAQIGPWRLEREFSFFNWLEGGVCTRCALGDQEKSIEGKFIEGKFGVE
ncbi:LysR family transcriptional regulator [Bradyrhizobium sp. 23AC]